MKLSLIIPCYNESANIPLLLDRCATIASPDEVEVILVDNGSTDSTPAVLEKLLPQFPGCRSVRVENNQGYGYGILSGLAQAEGDILAWTHADLQTDPQDALVGFEEFKKQGGNLFAKGRRYGRPFSDVVFTMGMSVFETMLLVKPLWDINAQPTMFSKAFYESWENPPHDFSLDLYAYYQAKKLGLSIFRFPVRFSERAHGVSHWNVNWSAKWKFIRRTMNFSFELRRKI